MTSAERWSLTNGATGTGRESALRALWRATLSAPSDATGHRTFHRHVLTLGAEQLSIPLSPTLVKLAHFAETPLGDALTEALAAAHLSAGDAQTLVVLAEAMPDAASLIRVLKPKRH